MTQLVNKSAAADLHATKMLVDMLMDAEQKAGMAPSEPAPFTPADEEVMATFHRRDAPILGGGAFASAIGWKGRYRIEGAAFIYANNLSGRVTAILGCPTAQLAQIG